MMEEEKAEGGGRLYRELKALSILTALLIETYNKLMCGWTGSLAKRAR